MNERYNRFGVMMCSAVGCEQPATHEVDCDSVVSYACLTHPDHPGKRLVFEFKCFAEDDDEEEVEDG